MNKDYMFVDEDEIPTIVPFGANRAKALELLSDFASSGKKVVSVKFSDERFVKKAGVIANIINRTAKEDQNYNGIFAAVRKQKLFLIRE